MRIALFSECYLPVTNGVVTSLLTLRETLRSWGHTVYVFAPGTQQPDDDADIFRLPELPFPRHPYHFARPFPRLSVDFETLGVQVIHCQHPFTVGRLGADTARRYGLPMVYTAHSLYATMAAYAKSPILRTMGPKAARGVVRRFCARADCVIAPSHATMDALIADGVRARFAVIPSGVLGPLIRPGARETVRARLGVAAETPLLLYVGRLGPEKHLEMLLEAVALLRNRPLPAPLAGFRLALVGDGQCRPDLESLTAELGIKDRVLFTGAQPHATIGDWYAAGDVFALSSPVETQGLVLVEAMAAGLPCVAVDDGGPRETLTHGETGLLVPFDPALFADALESLMRDPETRRRMGEKGRLRARDYSPEAMARGVLEVYEMVLKAPRRIKTASPERLRGAVGRLRRDGPS
ncbi:MAG TPA: glycosyltransferase [Chthonomonadaceae bacterium]|nr:glycosyltransferase [Chthonomonadaceae bacterium]